MDNWLGLLMEVVERYLKHMLRGAFRVTLLSRDGDVIGQYSGPSDPVPINISLIDYAALPTNPQHHMQPVLLPPRNVYENPSLAAAVSVQVGYSTKKTWLVVQCDAGIQEAELFAFCQIAAALFVDRITMEEKLRRLRHTVLKQDAIIDHISDGLLVLDRHGILEYCNEPASKILKINLQTGIGRPISEVLDFEPSINDVFQKGEGYIDREHQIESPSLSLHVIDTAIPIRDETGQIISVVNTFRRIERVKRLSYKMMIDRPLYGFHDLIGTSRSLKTAIAAGQKASISDTSVVLYGESGTGKELFAQSIHSHGARREGPFIAINCAAIPRDLVESELFGYTPGSFTGADTAGRPGKFELASGGTLFLDEVAEMPLEVQAKLLRVLQEKRVLRIGAAHSTPVDARIIAASNKQLKEMVVEGSFREDLFYRLSVIEIDIPALRDRSNDIPTLVEHFLHNYCLRASRKPIKLSNNAMSQLISYDWPGNVRQLQNIVERLVSLSDSDVVDSIPAAWINGNTSPKSNEVDANPTDTLLSMEQWERRAVVTTLEATDFNITRAAKLLGISRPTLYSKLKHFNIRRSV